LILSIFLLESNSCNREEKKEFKELSKVFQELNICMNVDEKVWLDSIKRNPDLKEKWRYFCDTTYFKIHAISPKIPMSEVLLLESQINQGSGEYDNFIIKKFSDGYRITCEFKGYLNKIIKGNDDTYKFRYKIYTAPMTSVEVLGIFNGEILKIDSILNPKDEIEAKQFFKGKSFCD
jgi:hypothetical protein